jgi:hypothetical protein
MRKNLKKGAKLGGTTRAATSITKESEDLLAEFGFKGPATSNFDHPSASANQTPR